MNLSREVSLLLVLLRSATLLTGLSLTLVPIGVRLDSNDALQDMRVLVLISLHEARQKAQRVDQLAGKYLRPVVLARTELLLAPLNKHHLKLVFD